MGLRDITHEGLLKAGSQIAGLTKSNCIPRGSGTASIQGEDLPEQVVVFPANGNGNIAPKRTVKGPNSGLTACGTVVVF